MSLIIICVNAMSISPSSFDLADEEEESLLFAGFKIGHGFGISG